eukprot:PhF_6_TR28329/c0_g1_i2/m.41977/K07952/ARFRP1; ADP-ribosylation factor related protein 1
MFHLFCAIWQKYFAAEEYKVLVLGPDGSGKTTLLESLKGKYTAAGPTGTLPPKAILPTVGLNIARIKVQGANILLWDLGGRPSLRSLWSKYYKNAQAVILVVDGSVPPENTMVWEDSRACLREILRTPALSHVPILIVENKMDVVTTSSSALPPPGGLLKLDEIFMSEGEGLWEVQTETSVLHTSGFGRWVYRCVRISALTGVGVEEGMKWLTGILRL